MTLVPLPSSFAATRSELQRVATHVLARRRFEVTGRFGLRATPGGFGTPAFGDAVEVLRTTGAHLLAEAGGKTRSIGLDGASLASLAAFAGCDLDVEFSCGHDTPDLGDVDAAVSCDPVAADVLGNWYSFGWGVLDAALVAAGPDASPSAVQLWPEHFDAGVDLASGPGGLRVNLGASPGDGFSGEPYLYVGPRGPERPGDPGFWNAPFGATFGYEELRSEEDPLATGAAFLTEGVSRLGAVTAVAEAV